MVRSPQLACGATSSRPKYRAKPSLVPEWFMHPVRLALQRYRIRRRLLLLFLLAVFLHLHLGVSVRKLATTTRQHSTKQRIPQTVHQIMGMYDKWKRPSSFVEPKDLDLPFVGAEIKRYMQSWLHMNGPRWEYRLWDRQDVERLLQENYPQYLPAWAALPKPVELADFARYLVLYHFGGVYADSDVQCLRPMASVLQPEDGLVAIWEDMVSEGAALALRYGHQAQITNWWMAAAPRHPAMLYVLDRIAEHAGTRLYADSRMDTIMRTGPGVFTEGVLLAAHSHPPSKGDGWAVRILPRVCGGRPVKGVSLGQPPIITHKFTNTWKSQPVDLATDLPARFPPNHLEPLPHKLLPTSVLFNPPFTLLHHLRGHGDLFGGADVSFLISLLGIWQPNNVVAFPPTMVEDLLAGLPEQPGPPGVTQAMVDVGAGYGMFSLAAAARGLHVVAFEVSPKAAAALQASIDWNGFPIRLARLALGEEREAICVSPPKQAQRQWQRQQQQQQQQQATAAEQEGVRRGYGPAAAHARMEGCQLEAYREPAEQAVLDALPRGAQVVAVRVSANTWGVRVLRALRPLLEAHPVRAVQLEWSPLPGGAGGGGVGEDEHEGSQLVSLLEEMLQLGFQDMRHSGAICAARWLKTKGGMAGTKAALNVEQVAVQGDTALLERLPCHLLSDEFRELEQGAVQEGRVEVFLLRRPADWGRPGSDHAA